MPFIQRFGSATARGFGLGKGGIVRLFGITESATAADLIQTLLARPGLITESASIADTLNNNISTASAINETASILDQNNYSAALNSIVTDSASATDSLSTIRNAQASVSDVMVIVDQAFRISTATSGVTENIIAAELISSNFATPRVVSEVVTVLQDEFQAMRFATPFATDAAVALDFTDATSMPAVRGVLMGGFYDTTSRSTTMQSININAQSNTTTFGSLITAVYANAACSSSTRGISAGGNIGTQAGQQIEYFAFSTGGTAQSFGTLIARMQNFSGASNEITGLFQGQPTTSAGAAYLQSIIIATTGTTLEFTSLPNRIVAPAAAASPTRFVLAGGYISTATANILYNDFASGGATPTFGDLTLARQDLGGLSSAVRAVFGGGRSSSAVTTYFNTIDYITLATTGNATTFGTLASAIAPSNSATSSPTRGVWMGGANANANVARVMRYITIDTTGNSLTFGELSTIRINGAACSNGHGGL